MGQIIKSKKRKKMKVLFIVFSMAFTIASMEGSVVEQRADSGDDRQQERVILSTFIANGVAAAAKAAICQNVNGDFFQNFLKSLKDLQECAKNKDLNACLDTAVAAIAKFIPGAEQ